MFNKNKKKKKTALGRVGRVEREQRYRQIVRITTFVVVGLVVLVTVIGIVMNTLIVPNRTIVTVNGKEISVGDYQTRVKLERDRLVQQHDQYYAFAVQMTDPTQQQQILSILAQIEAQLDPSIVGQSVMNQMIDELLIEEETQARGITVSDQEIEDYYYSIFGYYPSGVPTSTPTSEVLPTSTLSATQLALITPTPQPTAEESTDAEPTPEAEPTAVPEVPLPTSITEDEYLSQETEYLASIKEFGADETFVRRMVYLQILREKLNAELEKGITPQAEQVWARHILVADEATAQDILTQLQDGGDFGDLAMEFSTDGSAATGGDLGWFGRGEMVEPFEAAAFSGEVGDIVGPVESQFGFHLIQILGKEMRPVTGSAMDNLVYTALTEVLNERKTNSDIVFADNWINYAPDKPNVLNPVSQQ